MNKKILFLFCCILVTAALSAQVADMPPMYINFAVQDNYNLYPQANYNQNPANILQLDRPVFFTDLYLYKYGSEYKSVNTVDYAGGGAIGGSYTSISKSNYDRLSVDTFFPFSGNMVAGFGGMATLSFYNYTYTYIDYNADPENITNDRQDNSQSYQGNGFFALGMGNLGLGIRAGAYGYTDPYTVNWTTDQNQNDGNPYISSINPDYDYCRIRPEVILGSVYEAGPLTFGLSASGRYDIRKYTNYVAVDKDGDSFNEEAVTREEWYKTDQAWGFGGGTAYPDYTWADEETRITIGLFPHLIWDVNNFISVIGTGNWDVYDSRTAKSYERLDTDDHNIMQLDYIYTDFGFMGGIALRPCSDWEFRLGAGYYRYGRKQTNNDLDINGDTVFSADNPGHYAEVNWPNEPNNDRVINSVDTYSDTYHSYTDSMEGILGVEWKPSSNVVLFGRATLSFDSTTSTYSVFNTADNTVWEEIDKGSDWGFNYSTLVGAGVFVNDNLFLGIQGETGSLSAYSDEDTLPASGGTDTTGGQGGYNDLNIVDKYSNYSINIYCIIGL